MTSAAIPDLDFSGKTAVITGATRGIGRAIATGLAARGASVLVHGTNAAALERLVAELAEGGHRAAAFAGDVAVPATAHAALAQAEAKLGPVDILVNNAGINLRSSTLEMTVEDWQRTLDVNLNGTLHFCRAALPGMIARGYGRIVNVSSSTSKTPHKNAAPAYGASKAAVNYLTMHLAREMAPHGIRINAVCPGPVETDMTTQWDDAYRSRVLASLPTGRLGATADIAALVLFLASPAAEFIVGETININGGSYMN